MVQCRDSLKRGDEIKGSVAASAASRTLAASTRRGEGRGASLRSRARGREEVRGLPRAAAFSSSEPSSSSSPLPSPARRLQRLDVPCVVARVT